MSTIISFYGGPGVGKSTAAALVYADMKSMGLSVELVREVVKDWAWEGRKITGFSQYYTTAKQIMKESLLLGKVDYIVTDSPPALGIAYAERYYSEHIERAVRSTVNGYYDEARSLGHKFVDVLLTRQPVGYSSEGRWESEQDALEIDRLIKESSFGGFGIEERKCTSAAKDLRNLVDEILVGGSR